MNAAYRFLLSAILLMTVSIFLQKALMVHAQGLDTNIVFLPIIAGGSEPSDITRWDGGGDGTSWGDAQNWNNDSLPQSTSKVIIDASETTIEITSTVDIISIQSDAAIHVDKASFIVVHDKSTVNNSFTMSRGSGLIADGSNAIFSVNATTALDGNELIAVDGGQIQLPEATYYFTNVPDSEFYSLFDLDRNLSDKITLCFYVNAVNQVERRSVCAIGAGSFINLPLVKTVEGNEKALFRQRYTNIRALSGGAVNLQGLEAISQGFVRFLSSRTEGGNGNSSIDLSHMLDTGNDEAYIVIGDFGQIDIRSLPRLYNDRLELYQNSQITITELTEINESTLSVIGATYDFANVTSIDGSSLRATKGAKLSFSAITKFLGTSAAHYSSWVAEDSGSELTMPVMEEIVGNSFVNSSLDIAAKAEGLIKLGKVKKIPSGHVSFTSDGMNSLIDLSELMSFVKDGRGDSTLKVMNNGEILTPKLIDLDGVWISLDNSLSINTVQIKSLINGGIEANIVNPDFSGLTNITASGLHAINGAKISLPQVTNYEGSGGAFYTPLKAEGKGSFIDLSNMTAYGGNTFVNAATIVSALDGGQIDLSKVPNITSGMVQFTADGTGSKIDLSSLSHFERTQRGSSWLRAEHKGAIDLKNNTLSVQSVDVEIQSNGTILLGSLALNSESRLLGIGSIPGNVTNNGDTQPGGPTGILQVSGNYSQTENGILTIELKGKAPGILFDQLEVTGSAKLAGNLNLILLNSYQPIIGNTFEILKASSVNGTFTSVTGSDIGNGKKFEVIYGGNVVTLKVVALP